jgi:octaprenyl-diphosphate synthase
MLAARAQRDSQAQAPSFEDLRTCVSGPLAALSEFLDAQVDAFEPETQALVAYCLKHQGKRLRPMLVFLAGQSPKHPQAAQMPALVRAAAVIELVHQATLVHDDILDDASIRHNHDTPWAKYGASTAVLLGDALFAHALHLAASFETVAICRSVALATRRVCSGEIAQTFHRGTAKQGFELYFRVIDLKTAELFCVACELGASLSGFSQQVSQQAAAFGRHLGIAYQIFDDLADFAGDEHRIGKTLGTDLASGKLTLPLLYLLSSTSDEEALALGEQLRSGALSATQLLPRLTASGAIAKTTERFYQEIDKAESALDTVQSDYPAAEQLRGLAAFVRAQVLKLDLPG